MKKLSLVGLFMLCLVGYSFATGGNSSLTANFVTGNPEVQSISTITFGPEGILFIGDSKSAKVYAVDTKDTQAPTPREEAINIEGVDQKIAALIGTTTDEVNILDMAVNPVSQHIYLAVQKTDGTPILLKTAGEKLDHIDLKKISYSEVALSNPVGADEKDRRERPLRQWAITDMTYHNNNILISGLSNEEFSSTFRSIPFPFDNKETYASLEIYHAAHGRYETYAPVKTFMPYELNGKTHLIASFTCTPLVLFPMDDLQSGKHMKGRTVAELGSWNTPIDMISYQDANGNSHILMANTNRAVMRISPADIENFKYTLTEPVDERYGTAGVDFAALPLVNVQQLDNLDDENIILIWRRANGNLNLQSVSKKRL